MPVAPEAEVQVAPGGARGVARLGAVLLHLRRGSASGFTASAGMQKVCACGAGGSSGPGSAGSLTH